MLEVLQFRGFAPGPRLIVTGAIHGNETCGVHGIREVARQFNEGSLRLLRGTLTMVPVSNPIAHAAARREGDRNLNRDFRLYPSPILAEDFVANALAPLIAEHEVLLDLHSFSAPGQPFVFLGPSDNRGVLEPFARQREETAFALAMPMSRLVYGWLPTYASGAIRRPGGQVAYGIGTTEFMRSRGGYGITVECGQHADPTAPAVAQASVMAALRHLDMVDGLPAGTAQPDSGGTSVREWIRLGSIHDREADADRFVRPWVSFDPVQAGMTVALRADGREIRAERDCYIVFPNPGAPIDREWFYFGYPEPR